MFLCVYHLLTHLIIRTLARSRTHSLTHSLTHPLTHSLTHSPTHPLTLTHSPFAVHPSISDSVSTAPLSFIFPSSLPVFLSHLLSPNLTSPCFPPSPHSLEPISLSFSLPICCSFLLFVRPSVYISETVCLHSPLLRLRISQWSIRPITASNPSNYC